MAYFMFKVETGNTAGSDTLCAECTDLLLDDPNVEAEVKSKCEVHSAVYGEACNSCNYNDKGSTSYHVPTPGTTDRPKTATK